jgi:hypothetical protein
VSSATSSASATAFASRLCSAPGSQLGFERRYIGVLFWELRSDLRPDLAEYEIEHAFAQHVLLELSDKGVFDLIDDD